MGKKSLRKNKTIYQTAREQAGLTRKEASEQIGYLSENRLEKIERGKSSIAPAEVLAMERVYRDFTLASRHCQSCAIGQAYLEPVEKLTLAQIVLQTELALTHLDASRRQLLQTAAKQACDQADRLFLESVNEHLDTLARCGRTLEVWLKTQSARTEAPFESDSIKHKD